MTKAVIAAAAGVIVASAALVGFRVLPARRGTDHPPHPRSSQFNPQLFRTARDFELEGKRLEDLDDAERARNFREDLWNARVRFEPIQSGMSVIIPAWRALVEDASALLTPAQRDALLEEIFAHALARSNEQPDAFIDLIESQPKYRWNDGEASTQEGRRRDFQMGLFYTYFLERPMPTDDDLRHRLSEVWGGLAQHDHLFADAGVNAEGAAIIVSLARVPAQLDQLALTGKSAVSPDYWTAVSFRYGMQFSRPTVYATEAIAVSGSVTTATSHVIIRMQDGRLMNWITRWRLDAGTQEWTMDMTQASAARQAFIIW